jgi:hypothetical protein
VSFSVSTNFQSTYFGFAGYEVQLRGQQHQTDCEKYLAGIFSRDPNALFVDVMDGDGSDPTRPGWDMSYRPYGSGPVLNGSPEGETHNHLYNDPLGDITKAMDIYAPGGGTILDSGQDSNGQNFITIYYPNFGRATDVVLQIFHVENFNTRMIGSQTGNGVLLGQMGLNGTWTYQNRAGNPTGYHVHINAMKKWWKGKYVRSGKRATPKFQAKKDRQHVNLSSLCP